MPKWSLSDQNIYSLLNSSCTEENFDEAQLLMAYREFVESVITFLNDESDYKTLIRELNLTYIEFEALKNSLEIRRDFYYEAKSITCNKILSFINKELDLLHHQMEFPKFFINIEAGWKSTLHLNKDIAKYIDIMEIVCGLYYLKCITTVDGKEIHFSDLANAFEKLFNIKFSDIYKKEEEVIKRKPDKRTSFLDKLRVAIIEKCKEEGYFP